MYPYLLIIHSWLRWLVLLALLISIIKYYRGWKKNMPFETLDDRLRLSTLSIVHVQFVVGLWLYFISPVVAYFLDNFDTAIHERTFRFFGMEHITVMVLAVAMITIGSAKAKRKTLARQKFKTLTIWFTIALLAILSSIPWAFSPLVSRPLFRSLF